MFDQALLFCILFDFAQIVSLPQNLNKNTQKEEQSRDVSPAGSEAIMLRYALWSVYIRWYTANLRSKNVASASFGRMHPLLLFIAL